MEGGAPAEGEEYLLQFLAALPELPDLAQHRASALAELGVSYERQRRPDAAVSAYRQAAHVCEAAAAWARAARIHQNAAWCLIRSGKAAEAEQELEHSRLLLPAGPAEQAAQIVLEAVLAYHLEHTDRATDLAEEVLTPGCPGATPWARCCAAWVAGSVAADLGRLDLARVMLRAALRDAADSKDPAIMNMVTELRRRVGAE